MSLSPRLLCGNGIGSWFHAPDLEPSKDYMKRPLAADEAELTSDFLGAPKISEEKKQVASRDPLLLEMTLRGRGLAEDRTPSYGARNRIAAQIWIQMGAVVSL